MKRSFGRARRQLVAPQSGDHQHVGFADPGIELVVRGDAEVPDRQISQCEALLQLIGDMREADVEALSDGNIDGSREDDQTRLAPNGVRSMPGGRPATRSDSNMPVMPDEAIGQGIL
jgi:hypothetical protein